MGPPLYLIALVPDQELRERVRTLKEEMRERFGAAHALKSPAHLTLQMPFRYGGEEHLLGCLKLFSKRETPFEVELDGYDCFEPRVVFIRIVDHQPIVGLHSRLKTVLEKDIPMKGRTVTKEIHPHMTIATRDLPEEAFYLAWPEYQQRGFRASFRVQSLFLLKHNGRHWDIFREFEFEN